MQSVAMQPAQDFDQAFVDTVIAERASRPGALLGILHKVQEHQPGHYLPTAVLEYIAAKTATPLSRVYSVVTFYALFSLEPQGRNTVCICRGTACHTRGSRDLLETAMMSLGLQTGQDGELEVLTVTHTGPQRHAAHGGLLRPTRPRAGGRGQSHHLRSYERAFAAQGA